MLKFFLHLHEIGIRIKFSAKPNKLKNYFEIGYTLHLFIYLIKIHPII